MWRLFEKRMNAEMQFHLDQMTDDFIAQGLPPDEARRKAVREFGALELAKDESRDTRTFAWLDHAARDVRYAARSLKKAPGFVTAAILTLALGIGANAGIFSVVYSVLLKPLPYRQPDQIYSVEVVIPERRSQFASLPVPIQGYLEWRKTPTAFAEMAVLRPWEVNLVSDGEPERVGGARVSTNFFEFLGNSIARGRGFTSDEETPGNENVVVISDALWRRRYNADPALIGKSIRIGEQNHLVVGIAAPSLLVPTQTLLHPNVPFAPRVDVWKPIAPSKRELQSESWDHGLLARLKPGHDTALGRQQLDASLNAMYRAQGFNTNLQTQLVPIREIYSGKVRLRLLLILAASALLLLTACANMANLFVARVSSRAHEFATRLSLGAGRARILSQILAETTLLALLGGAAGVAIAHYGAGLLGVYGPEEVRLLSGARLVWPAFFFAIATSLAVSIACALLPTWQMSRRGSREASRSRQVLVGMQMAFGTALLASAGLLLHSYVKLMQADRGYQVERVIAVDLALFGRGQDSAAFYRQLTENLRNLPGVQAAGAINDLPASAGESGASRTIFYATDTDFQGTVLQRPVALIRSITTGYFAASGTSLAAGRYFTDLEPEPVALISESLAARLWPREKPADLIGRTLRQGNVKGPLITVTGVVKDVRPGAADRQAPPLIYRPYPQWASSPATVIVKTAQDPATLAPQLRAEIRKLNANLPIPAIRTMREIISASVAERRLQMALTLLFALVALLLGVVGVYGVVSYAVVCRTRDIGLRIALGASRNSVMAWVLRYGMQPVLIGLLAGLGSAIAIATTLRSLLFGIAPTDPLSLGSVVILLLGTSILACYFPARRAAGLDPTLALRHD